MVTKKDLSLFYNLHQIPQDMFEILTPMPNIFSNGNILAYDTLIVYEE